MEPRDLLVLLPSFHRRGTRARPRGGCDDSTYRDHLSMLFLCTGHGFIDALMHVILRLILIILGYHFINGKLRCGAKLTFAKLTVSESRA